MDQTLILTLVIVNVALSFAMAIFKVLKFKCHCCGCCDVKHIPDGASDSSVPHEPLTPASRTSILTEESPLVNSDPPTPEQLV